MSVSPAFETKSFKLCWFFLFIFYFLFNYSFISSNKNLFSWAIKGMSQRQHRNEITLENFTLNNLNKRSYPLKKSAYDKPEFPTELTEVLHTRSR